MSQQNPRRIRALVVRVIVWALVVALVWYLVRVLRRVDWSQVWDALGHLSWWQVVTLLVLVVVRAALSSAPLAFFVKDLGLPRAIGNDLVGNLAATVTPAPADIVARAALFRSWGVDVGQGMAGLVLNSILYYVVRLAAPVAGALLMLWTVGDEGAVGWAAVISGLVSAAIVTVLVIGSRSSASAGAVGRFLGRCAIKIRRSLPGPDRMEKLVVDFHARIAGRWLRFWPHSLIALVAMVLVESGILVLAIRFVGVPPSQAPLLVIVASFLSVYLLMATPFLGLGVLDAAVVALIADRAGATASELVAGVIIWRVCVQLVPLLAGIAPLLTARASGLVDGGASDSGALDGGTLDGGTAAGAENSQSSEVEPA
ncbi:Lysylphosphatidylglycerol synthase TM region [Sanguibacter gelidistatuariae]|uniref:Lysylphosphatidylglycerol synthase TM region n=1 Tax=Sanguibacter gelidistatuariae TaxID=1814289 RepID=A0A1G6HRD1_9MICO|nr:lysylphosphatidylglycerol synthase transmembrane domain-containing protein [Sanguibacter gelidistatuariae]SDB96713.1 Lysylphosphatidylglycerol synthase TM region [Sanguibacter gelidistatuariae]